MRHPESQSQISVIRWWAFAHRGFKVPEHMLFAVPNGGFRNKIEAVRLIDEGVRPGVADLILLVPRGPFHGLCLEMKAEDGKVSKNQLDFLKDAESQHYAASIAYSTEDAINAITNYLRTQ